MRISSYFPERWKKNKSNFDGRARDKGKKMGEGLVAWWRGLHTHLGTEQFLADWTDAYRTPRRLPSSRREERSASSSTAESTSRRTFAHIPHPTNTNHTSHPTIDEHHDDFITTVLPLHLPPRSKDTEPQLHYMRGIVQANMTSRSIVSLTSTLSSSAMSSTPVPAGASTAVSSAAPWA